MRFALIICGVVILLVALGNLALIGVMSRFKPQGGPLVLHAPAGPGAASPFLSTPPEVVDGMLRLAAVKPNEVVYDLGCGDARILVAATRTFGARGVGIELDPQVFALAAENVRKNALAGRVTLIRGNMFDADVRSADVVALYLLPEALGRLRPLLEQQLHPGARVVTHDFQMPGWTVAETRKIPRGDGTFHTIHLYRLNH
jgi:SAM-dependent methyltransferase